MVKVLRADPGMYEGESILSVRTQDRQLPRVYDKELDYGGGGLAKLPLPVALSQTRIHRPN
jgi:hypothetical protein